MARPKIDSDKKKSLRFVFRLTEDELKKLAAMATTAGLSPSALIRHRLFKGKFPIAKAPRIELNTYIELKRSGNNLNQLTRKVNSGFLPEMLRPALLRLLAQQQTIINLLIHDSESEDR